MSARNKRRAEIKALAQQYHRQLPRLAICLPSGDLIHKAMAVSLAALVLNSAMRAAIALVDRRGSIIDMLRNDCVHDSLELPNGGAEWILFWDSDMDVPPDALNRLLDHGKDVVGCLYQKRTPPFDTVGRIHDCERGRDLSKGGLFKAEKLGTGFLLVKSSVFRKIGFPWFKSSVGEEYGKGEGEDYFASRRMREEGIELWCDLGLSFEIGHYGQRRVVIGQPDEAEAYVTKAKDISAAA